MNNFRRKGRTSPSLPPANTPAPSSFCWSLRRWSFTLQDWLSSRGSHLPLRKARQGLGRLPELGGMLHCVKSISSSPSSTFTPLPSRALHDNKDWKWTTGPLGYCSFIVQQAGFMVRGSERFLGEENDNPLQCSCLVNPMDRGAWWATVHGVAKNQT